MRAKVIFGLLVVCFICNAKTYAQEFHTLDTSKAYRSGYSAKIENVAGLDGNDKAIVIVNPQRTSYQHQVAAWFRQGFWWVSNIDQSPMQAGNYFEIQFYRNPTAAAFAHKATPQNLINGKSRIDNPALDNRPDAHFFVYQSFSNNNGGLLTQYVATPEYNEAEKKWYLVNTGGQPISAGNSYSIVIDRSGGVGGKEPLEKPAGLGSPKENVANDLASRAGGDLKGNFPNPNVIGLQGRPLSNLQPKVGDTLMWDGTQWRPSSNPANTPTEPLKFNPTLGKKITLYPGQTGDVGLSVAGNLLQIHSDKPNADVAIGFDQSGSFNEKFRVKSTGAIAVSGDAGQPGQVLTSNGASSAPTWTQPSSNIGAGGIQTYYKNYNNSVAVPIGNGLTLTLLSQTINLTKPSKVVISAKIAVSRLSGSSGGLSSNLGSNESSGMFFVQIDGRNPDDNFESTTYFEFKQSASPSIANYVVALNAGSHTIDFRVLSQGNNFNVRPFYSSVLVIPVE